MNYGHEHRSRPLINNQRNTNLAELNCMLLFTDQSHFNRPHHRKLRKVTVVLTRRTDLDALACASLRPRPRPRPDPRSACGGNFCRGSTHQRKRTKTTEVELKQVIPQRVKFGTVCHSSRRLRFSSDRKEQDITRYAARNKLLRSVKLKPTFGLLLV